MALEAHLFLHEQKLGPGEEWTFSGSGWRFMSVLSGQAYWLSQEPQSLDPGCALMLSPAGSGTLRASQLTPLTFSYFHFLPDRLTDLLSPVERHYLELPETCSRFALRSFAAADPFAQQFSALARRAGAQNSLASRSAILQLISSAVGIEATIPKASDERLPCARERFQEVIGQMTDVDFIRCSVESLADQCRCSTRHLSRLFLAAFGVSFSSRQTEMRMQKAARLLRETHLKVSEIAGECGYRHIGLFNATFKRRWKHTPTEWRHARQPETEIPVHS